MKNIPSILQQALRHNVQWHYHQDILLTIVLTEKISTADAAVILIIPRFVSILRLLQVELSASQFFNIVAALGATLRLWYGPGG